MAKLISTTTMILQNLFLVKNKGVKTGCARKGGRGKHNIFSLGGAFRKTKYEIRRRKNRNRKARAGKNSFPPTPFLFARPSVQFDTRSAPSVPFKKSSDFVKQTHSVRTLILLGKINVLTLCVCLTKSELFLNGTDGALRVSN